MPPTLHGPFLTRDAMLTAAKTIHEESPEDSLMNIDVPRGVEPKIDVFTDAMLETKEPFIEAMAEGLRRGEAVITRLKVDEAAHFTCQYQGEEVVLTDTLFEMLADEVRQPIYCVEDENQEVAMLAWHALERFHPSDWIKAVNEGATLHGLDTWRQGQLDKLQKLARWP